MVSPLHLSENQFDVYVPLVMETIVAAPVLFSGYFENITLFFNMLVQHPGESIDFGARPPCFQS